LDSLSEVTFGRDIGLEYFPVRIECRDQERNYFRLETWFWGNWTPVAVALLEAAASSPGAMIDTAAKERLKKAAARTR
jgi:hypothetical protein